MGNLDNKNNNQSQKKDTSKSSSLVFDSSKDIKINKAKTQTSGLQFEKTNTANIPQIKKDTSQSGTLQFEKTKPVKALKIKKSKEELEKMSPKEKAFYIMKVAFFTLIGLFLSGSIIIGLIIGNWLSDLPELDTTLLTNVSQSSLIYDKDGNLLTSYSSYENREWADLEEMPQPLIDAVLSIEDHDFYNHKGIYVKRLAGAILGQLTGRDDYGGSTITQQLIKNVYLTHDATYKRKAQELVLALELEKKMSKDDILEAYMNIIYLGGSNYGVKSAARDYFDKDLNELTIRECACIAGLAKNPNGYSPRRNMEKGDMTPTNKRTEDVLWAMHQRGKLTDAEYEFADKDTLVVAEAKTYSESYPYPHFLEYVLDEVATDLLISEGKEVNSTNIMYKKYAIRNGGYKIYTTIDPYIQETLQSSAANFEEYPETEDEKGVEVSAVIIDHTTGRIVGMIGSKEEPIAQETFNRAVDSTQPIGSTMKPIAIFAPAIERGASPSTLTGDYKSSIKGYDVNNGYPGGNCSNKPMTMREAVANSHNIPAARFLIENVGIEVASDYLIRMGVNSNNISRNGSGIALGTSDTTTLEITGAYATLANNGIYIEPHAYTKVLNRYDEEILSESDKPTRRVFSEATAWLTTDMLIDEVKWGGGTNAKISGITVAGKTGTHEDKCITFAGYTGYYTSVVRISSDNYSSMYNASGGKQTAKLWQSYMSAIHEDLEDVAIRTKTAEELDIKKFKTCSITGLLADEMCEALGCTLYDYFLNGTQPKEKCDSHIKVCTVTGKLFKENCDVPVEGVDPELISKYKIVTYIPSSSYLYKINHSLLESSLENIVFEKPTEECDQEHIKPPTPPEESTEPTDPNNPDNPFPGFPGIGDIINPNPGSSESSESESPESSESEETPSPEVSESESSESEQSEEENEQDENGAVG